MYILRIRNVRGKKKRRRICVGKRRQGGGGTCYHKDNDGRPFQMESISIPKSGEYQDAERAPEASAMFRAALVIFLGDCNYQQEGKAPCP